MKGNHSILFFHPYFRDGGVERTNIGLSRELIKQGYDVSFVTINPTSHFVDEVRSAGVKFIVLPAKSTLLSQFQLIRWIRHKRKNTDSLTVISCQYYVNILCLFFRPFWGKDVLHILSERNHFDEFEINQHGFKQKIISKTVPLLYRFADIVIGNSQELADDLEKITGRPVGVVYNPTLNDRFYEMANDPVTEPWFLSLERPVFIGIGRLSKQKGFDVLIKSFIKFSEHQSGSLVILGDGDERAVLESLFSRLNIDNAIILPGFVKNPYKFIKAADTFVLSSRYEGLPNVLIESLALKTPVISTKCRSGPREILGDGAWGKLVEVDNVELMSEALTWAINSPEQAKAMTEKAENKLSRFTATNAGLGLVSVIREHQECHV